MAKKELFSHVLQNGIGGLLGPRLTVVALVILLLTMLMYFMFNYPLLK